MHGIGRLGWRWRGWALCLALGVAGLALPVSAQIAPGAAPVADSAGQRIWSKLQAARLVDPGYYPDVAEEVAATLAQAAPGQWRGVQVNRPYQRGWLNLIMVDPSRVRDAALLADDGVADLSAESLAGGALAHEETGIVFVNTLAWKRLAAATVIKQLGHADGLMAAVAMVDAAGLSATERYWSPATLDADTDTSRRAAMLVRGAFAFVLAHEMGHLRIGPPAADADLKRVLPTQLSERQKDERYACPDTLGVEAQQRQRHESAADLAAVRLLGQQCRIGADGRIRHQIYLLGSAWYFTYAMADKLLAMARNTSSPFIERLMTMQLGAPLYRQAVAEHAQAQRRGGVRIAFPSSHPPDHARWQAIDAALRDTPCGGSGLGESGAQLMETMRAQMCRSLTGGPR